MSKWANETPHKVEAMFLKITREDLVFEVLSDGNWHTLADLANKAGYPEASVSCSIRTLRKPGYGNFTIEKEYSEGVWIYRMVG